MIKHPLILLSVLLIGCSTYTPVRNTWILDKEFTPIQGVEYDTTVHARCQTVNFPNDPMGKKTRKYYIRFVYETSTRKKVERAHLIEPWESME